MATEPQKKSPFQKQACDRCEGKGYDELRDCGGEIQRTKTCSFCEGRGYIVPTSQE